MSAQARVVTGITLALISLCGATAAHYLGPTVMLWLKPLIEGVRHTGATGWLVFLAIQIAVSALGFIPASLIGVAAGLAYGTYIGFLLSAAGTLAGGCIAFQLSRSLMRPFVLKFVSKRQYLVGMDEGISRKGWWLVCLLRISPSMPFAATSYALGLTRIGFVPYLIGSLICHSGQSRRPNFAAGPPRGSPTSSLGSRSCRCRRDRAARRPDMAIYQKHRSVWKSVLPRGSSACAPPFH
jgi:uncharacterized membrane protein YdjX (TVP38/TMEM64 family)